MNTAIRLFSLAVALNCSILTHAAPYSFSRVYTGSVYPGVAINDNGLVALINGTSLITTDGNTPTTIAGPLGPNYLAWPIPQCLSINNSGYVAFRGSVGGNTAVLASNGSSTRTVAVNATGYPSFQIGNSSLPINDNGTVAFEGLKSGAGWGLYVGDGTGNAQLVRSAISQSPAINTAGTIAYRDIPTSAIEILKGSEVLSLDVFAPSFMPDINDSGTVAVISGEHQITIGDGTASPTYIDGSAYAILGSGYVIELADPCLAINDPGVVAFGAYTDTAGETFGIFVGPDPNTDNVIVEGDLLDGATVDSLLFARGGLNNKGQIAFTATLSNGTSGVFVATPVPEPANFLLATIALLALLGHAWRRGN